MMCETEIKLVLNDYDAYKLETLAHVMRCSKSEVLRRAIGQMYDEALADKRIIVLSEEAFDAFCETLNSPLTEEERKGRERLKAAANLWKE